MLAKKTVKNQITLPKKIVEQFPGVDYFEVSKEDGCIVLRPVHPQRVYEVRERLDGMGISEKDVDRAVSWARRKRR